MAYFPFFVDIEGRRCLIVGGGRVASRKASSLLAYGPEILVVSRDVSPSMEETVRSSGGRVLLCRRGFEDRDLFGADFVIACTGDKALNHRISSLCRAGGVPVNVVDDQEECSFIFPSILREGAVTVGISTGGRSPALAKLLKERIREALPRGIGELAEGLGACREDVKRRVPEDDVRSAVFQELARIGIRDGAVPTPEDAEELITRKLEECHESGDSDRDQKERPGADTERAGGGRPSPD